MAGGTCVEGEVCTDVSCTSTILEWVKFALAVLGWQAGTCT